MNKQLEFVSFSPPINFAEKSKWLLTVTSFQATNSILQLIDENNSFSISTPGHWSREEGEELINKLSKFLKLRSENDIELHVREVEKRSTRIERENSGYNVAGFDHFRSETLAELKRVNYKDLEDMF